MKIFLTQTDLNKFDKLKYVKETNIGVASITNALFNEIFPSLNNIDLKEDNIEKEYKDFLINQSLLNEEEGFNEVDQFWNIFKVDLLKESSFLDNPYYQKVKDLKDNKQEDVRLFFDKYVSFEPFLYDEIAISNDGYYIEKQPLGFFKEPFNFLSLAKKDLIWMSVTPHEINTMKNDLTYMKGNVLVLGLGLGYFSYMCSLKKEVSSITVIEKDPIIIDIYQKFIEPRLKANKVKIIQADAYKVLQSDFINEHHIDSVFIDLWHNAQDGIIHYLKLKRLMKSFNGVICRYWIEKTIICYFRRYVISYIDEQIEGFKESAYLKPKGDDDRIICFIHRLLKNTSIKSFKDINSLLKEESLIELASMNFGE